MNWLAELVQKSEPDRVHS